MKIGIVNVVSKRMLEDTGYLDVQRNNFARSLGPDVELVFEGSANDDEQTYTDVMFNPFLSALDGATILRTLYRLQEEGCDAVVISCAMDPLLHQARSFLRIPIVGTIEAATMTACMTGPKFGFLMHRDRRCAEATEEVVARYGLRSRMSPTVYASQELSDLMWRAYESPEIVRDEVIAGCVEVIERGAHSVIIGGIGLANLVTACGITEVPGYGAPVLDPISVALQMLRYRVELHRSLGIPVTSQASEYRRLPDDLQAQALRQFDFIQ